MNLEGANLRHVVGLRLNTTRTRGARFTAGARDPWSILRRNYTGAQLAFRLLLLLAFVLPYMAKTMFWIGVNRSQATLMEIAERLEKAAANLASSGNPDASALAEVVARTRELEASMTRHSRKWSVWQLLLGLDKSWTYSTLAIALLLYYAARGLLTWRVGPLRDEEERSGYSPSWREYGRLFVLHRIATVLFVVSLASFVWHGVHWLFTPVWLPA
ncbi:MAG: hypothetical protein L0170_09900 [Acidobacteria bacterium]|nr:hypothetical protein [Acidobacteriota bacterium]